MESLVDSSRADEGRVQLLWMIRGHHEDPTGGVHHPVKNVEQTREI